MNRQQRQPQGRNRQLRIEAVPRRSPDLNKLAQVFMGMAIARAEQDRQHTQTRNSSTDSEPEQSDEVE